MTRRILNWDGCTNARDLGGLHTLDGLLQGGASQADLSALRQRLLA